MKKFIILIIVFVLFLTVNVFTEEKSAEEQAMMKKWMEYSTPGQYHKGLEYFTGRWDIVSKMWMKPGEKPMESKGTQNAKMILGGRFLKTSMKGSSMGMEFTGMSITGYDNLNKKFVGYWMDSFGTGVFPYEGSLDKTGKVRTDTGLWDDLMTGGKQKVRMVTTTIDKDTYKFEMFMTTGKTPEYKNLEMTYSRTKCDTEKKCCAKQKGHLGKKCDHKKGYDHKKKCDHKKTGEVKKKCCDKKKCDHKKKGDVKKKCDHKKKHDVKKKCCDKKKCDHKKKVDIKKS